MLHCSFLKDMQYLSQKVEVRLSFLRSMKKLSQRTPPVKFIKMMLILCQLPKEKCEKKQTSESVPCLMDKIYVQICF